MSNITKLPDNFQREWRVYEGVMRDAFTRSDASVTEIDYLISKLKPICIKAMQHPFKRIINENNSEDVFNELNEWVKQQVFSLILEIAKRDIELFRLRGTESHQ